MQTTFIVVMFIIGACIGSFLCCQARRMRAKETSRQSFGPRSVCFKCNHKLKWCENIPIISWLVLKGKCKKCGTRIGYLEIFSEISSAIIMALLATTFDISTTNVLGWIAFVVLIILVSLFILLAIYDGSYGELPTKLLIATIVIAVIYAILKTVQGEYTPIEITLSTIILGGLYLALYVVSKGKWVGDGDWLLAGAIGLALGKPFLALVALFVSNFSACVIMWPSIHKTKNHKVYFGPFLVLGFIVTFIISNYGIINLW